MKILLDKNIARRTKDSLVAAGHDVLWVGDWASDPGDEAILSQAFAEDRILVTQDKDFGQLAIVRGMPHRGIIRLVGLASFQQADVVEREISHHGMELQLGAIVTAKLNETRIRPSEPTDS